jgi:hypothetical protein
MMITILKTNFIRQIKFFKNGTPAELCKKLIRGVSRIHHRANSSIKLVIIEQLSNKSQFFFTKKGNSDPPL